MGSVLDDIFGNAPSDRTRETILLQDIKRDGGTQMRAGLDEPTVLEYADAMRTSGGWGTFPPLVVYYDGSNYWLADGFHRWRAAWEAHGSEYDAPCEVRAGTQRDAMLHAASANSDHGLRRTNADKRRAVLALLQDPEWSQWSDGEIARRCKVSQPFVSGLRPKPLPTHNGYESTPAAAPAPVVRKGGDGREINTANIGKTQPTYAEMWRLEAVIMEQGFSAVQLREAASKGNEHWVWGRSRDAIDSKSLRWRVADLTQALNNVAARMEAKAQRTNSPNLGTAGSVSALSPGGTPTPAPPTKPMVDWTEDEWNAAETQAAEVDAATAARNAARRDRALRLLATYRAVLESEGEYSNLTGDFVGTIPVVEGLRRMIAGLERLVGDLS